MVRSPLLRYFRSAAPPSVEEVRPEIWTEAPEPSESAAIQQSAVLEQYKLYVEMTDRISARRGLTNTFFLTLNTGVATFVATTWRAQPHHNTGFALFLLFIMLIQCLSWYWILRSYRQLNAAKYAVIGALEEKLPASPYWRAEWKALGHGKDPARYLSLTHLEQWVPTLFGLTYAVAFIVIATM
jgi:hypothetical protein